MWTLLSLVTLVEVIQCQDLLDVTPIDRVVASKLNHEMSGKVDYNPGLTLAKIDPDSKDLILVKSENDQLVKFKFDPGKGLKYKERTKIGGQIDGGRKPIKLDQETLDLFGDLGRGGRDLVYERMKMRTGNWETRKRDEIKFVGGGILEKKLLLTEEDDRIIEGRGRQQLNQMDASSLKSMDVVRAESREMQCCDEVEVTSTRGVAECHPYVLGKYKKIGGCGGRSFFQHRNNTDIFLYHACGSWYVGLEIGSCGGWIIAKSAELCPSAPSHLNGWKFFDDGQMIEDESFNIGDTCKFFNDFRPVPEKPHHGQGHHNNHHHIPQFPAINYPNQPIYQTQPKPQTNDDTVKHEHIHYHIKVDEDDVALDDDDNDSDEDDKALLVKKFGLKGSPNRFFPVSSSSHQIQVSSSNGDDDSSNNDDNDKVAHILINNYNTHPRTPPTAASFQQEKPNIPYAVIKEPESDLQFHQSRPMTLSDKVHYDLIRPPAPHLAGQKVVGSNGGSYTYHHGDPNKHLVGYIIKKKSPLEIEYSVQSGRASPDMHMESEPEQSPYFPLKRKKSNDDKT